MRACWCGSVDLHRFNAEYATCGACGTLVSQASLTDEQLTVRDDDVDFYGKQYWLAHQASDLGFPDIHARVRNDLTERNLHWLRTLLKYRPPAADTIELGCAHGSFVALMQQAGYRSRGVEMSAWVVDFGRKTFGVPIDVGPIESLDVPAGSLDVIALMDVLEHLPNPLATMKHCLSLLRPDGVMLIQTPCFQNGMQYETLRATDSPFLEQLKYDEHLYLFTRDSVRRLFAQIGLSHIAFEPAIFAQYDMFFVVGKVPLRTYTDEEARQALVATPGGHLIGAMLDLRERELSLVERFAEAEADRSARGAQVETLGATLQQVEADRVARGVHVDTLTTTLQQVEADRVARGAQVETLTATLRRVEADHSAGAEQIATLTKLLQASETDRSARAEQIVTLDGQLREVERDRAERGRQIAVLTEALTESEADRAKRSEQIAALTKLLEHAEADRASRGEQILTLTTLLQDAEADRSARGLQLSTLHDLLEESERDRAARADQIATLDSLARSLQVESNARGEQIEMLTNMVHEARAKHGR